MVKADADEVFNLDALSARKKESRTCRELHPGLCRTAHKEIYAPVKRLAKQMYDSIVKMQKRPDEGLVEIGGPHLKKQYWIMRMTKKPKHVFFAEASKITEHGIEFLDLKRPLVRETNFSVGVHLMNQRVGGQDWSLQELVHRTDAPPLWRARDVGRGELQRLTLARQAKASKERSVCYNITDSG